MDGVLPAEIALGQFLVPALENRLAHPEEAVACRRRLRSPSELGGNDGGDEMVERELFEARLPDQHLGALVVALHVGMQREHPVIIAGMTRVAGERLLQELGT